MCTLRIISDCYLYLTYKTPNKNTSQTSLHFFKFFFLFVRENKLTFHVNHVKCQVLFSLTKMSSAAVLIGAFKD